MMKVLGDMRTNYNKKIKGKNHLINHHSLLLGQDNKPLSESMLNRKMVFRVTKSVSV